MSHPAFRLFLLRVRRQLHADKRESVCVHHSVTANMQAEFRAWLVEERHINPETISKSEEKKQIATFVEDHNTATFPHEKYYNLEVRDELEGGFARRKLCAHLSVSLLLLCLCAHRHTRSAWR